MSAFAQEADACHGELQVCFVPLTETTPTAMPSHVVIKEAAIGIAGVNTAEIEKAEFER
jgi:hypothetical protein